MSALNPLQQFVDEVEVHVSSGAGGPGSVSFRREKYVPRGGPDGGDGGRGGDVIVRVRRDLRTLVDLTRRRTIAAERGHAGSGRNRHGRDGRPAVIDVPPGTAVYDAGTGDLLYDAIDSDGQFELLRGGRGGKGNAHFATSRNQTPRFAQPGEPGEELRLRVELRIIADIGFVGKPNAGKSSLLGRLTAATPKIGAYPFTTKIPNLGVMSLGDEQLILADIPGLIEGASDGAGLGFRFLRHVSRTRMLAYVLDLEVEDPAADLHVLEHELAAFSPALAARRRLLVANKVDLPEAAERLDRLRAAMDEEVVAVSALSGAGIRELAGRFLQLARELPVAGDGDTSGERP